MTLLTKKDVAAKMQLSERTIDRMRKQRAIPFLKVGNSVRFIQADIDTYLTKRKIK